MLEPGVVVRPGDLAVLVRRLLRRARDPVLAEELRRASTRTRERAWRDARDGATHAVAREARAWPLAQTCCVVTTFSETFFVSLSSFLKKSASAGPEKKMVICWFSALKPTNLQPSSSSTSAILSSPWPSRYEWCFW
eukprot:3153828-Prymnesium_polylepis.1